MHPVVGRSLAYVNGCDTEERGTLVWFSSTKVGVPRWIYLHAAIVSLCFELELKYIN